MALLLSALTEIEKLAHAGYWTSVLRLLAFGPISKKKIRGLYSSVVLHLYHKN